jgi:hypothetical protein
LPTIKRRYFAGRVAGLDHEDQAMQYDWTGVRTRRIRRLKMAVYASGGFMAALSPVTLLPGIDLAPYLALVW